MRRIPLSQGKCALVSNKDYAYLLQWRWFAVRARQRLWYASAHAYKDGKRITIYMHRLIANRKGCQGHVDHVDGNGLNNIRSNLRLVTIKQNSCNRGLPSNNTSGCKGVSKTGPRQWRAHLKTNGKSLSFPTRRTRREAASDYNKAAIRHFGTFAWLNPINEET